MMSQREQDELIAKILEVDPKDPEAAHAQLDELAHEALPEEVRRAYDLIASRCRWWAFA